MLIDTRNLCVMFALHNYADGVELFEEFLRSEFSDENIQFWKACERFKTVPEDTLEKEAEAIFEEYLSEQSPKLVSVWWESSHTSCEWVLTTALTSGVYRQWPV